MTDLLLMGIDLGTTGVKAVVFDHGGNIRSLQYESYNVEAVHGRRELQPVYLWDSCERVIRAAAAECAGEERAAICVSSFGEGFTCLNESGQEISPVMLLTDDRGSREFDEIVEQAGSERIAEICGLKPHVSYSLSKILYLKKYCPEIYSQTKHILLMGDYIYYKLGGIYYTDYSLASRTMLFDVHSKQWSQELMDIAGVDKALFSQPVQGGSIVGKINQTVAKSLGLPADTTLIMGGHDQPVAAVVSRGRRKYSLCSMGTSECITPILQTTLDRDYILKHSHPNEPFMQEGVYNTLAYNVTSGLLTEWSTKVFTRAERLAGENVYAILESEMPQEPTRLMVLPYLHGSGTPYLDANARLSILGMDEVTRRGDIYRGILEGLCMDQRLNVDMLGWEQIGEEGILITGGGSRSQQWVQIKADILEQPIHRLECHQAGALGCAVLCAIAMGIYNSMEEAVEAMVRVKEEILPQKETAGFYREKYEIYKELYASCRKANIYAAASVGD